nr:methyltransferase-like protein 7b [Quercus suber]
MSTSSRPPPPQESGPFQLLRPLLLIFYSASYLPLTVVHLLLSLNLTPFLSPPAFKDIWFARFWTWFGPRSKEFVAPHVVPLLSAAATGVCLDIGPGAGQWVHLFARAQNPRITKIYGVEPNADMHAELRANADRAGLADVYEIVGCGAQELRGRAGWTEACVDTIVTVHCLCSVPTPEVVINELYPLLRPGGKWLVFEHVRTKFQGEFVGGWQRAINRIWPTFFNGCDITRPTDEWLLGAGEWEEVDLRPAAGEGKYDTVPHVMGTLTKRK